MGEQLWIDAVKVEAHGEDAARIVAALKELEGIPTAALQGGCLRALLDDLVAFYDQSGDIDCEREIFLLERLGFLGGAAAACCARASRGEP